MDRITKGYRSNDFQLGGKGIKHINFYDENGLVIHTISNNDFYRLKNENGKTVEELNVLHILQNEKFFRKAETEKEFVNKFMKKQINFSYLHPDKDYWTKEHDVELYLFVDNEYITVLEQKERVEVLLNDYDFSKAYSYYDDIKLDIFGTVITHSESTDYKVVQQEELQKQAKELFNEVVKVSYITESEFNRIFNKYELVKRDNPLLVR